VIVNSGSVLSSIGSAMMKPLRPFCVSGFSEASSVVGVRSHGVTSTVADRGVDADDENFMKTSRDAQASSGAMLLIWNN
jgi:hypothetical protein